MSIRLFPSEEELTAFEDSYAGAHTPQLEEMAKACRIRIPNKYCLVCLVATQAKTDRTCNICPRRIHPDCLDNGDEWLEDAVWCPLCRKRGWDVIDPKIPNGPVDDTIRCNADNWLMQRAQRKHAFEKAKAKSEWMRKYAKLLDDGSIESDRRLLIEMGVIGIKRMTAHNINEIGNEVNLAEGKGMDGYWQDMVNGVFDAAGSMTRVFGQERPTLALDNLTPMQQLELFRLRERLTVLLQTPE